MERAIETHGEVPIDLLILLFDCFDPSVRNMTQLFFKRQLFIRFSDLFGHIVLLLFLKDRLLILLLARNQVAKTALFLLFLHFLPYVRGKSVIHGAPLCLFFKKDERATPLALERLFILALAQTKNWRLRI